jgi:hypothetical protein
MTTLVRSGVSTARMIRPRTQPPARVATRIGLSQYAAFLGDGFSLGVLLGTLWLGLKVTAACLRQPEERDQGRGEECREEQCERARQPQRVGGDVRPSPLALFFAAFFAAPLVALLGLSLKGADGGIGLSPGRW